MAGNLELRMTAGLTLLHLSWEIKIIQAQSEWNGTGNAILLHFLAFMAGNEEGRISEVFCVLQFKVMATTSIQVYSVNRDQDQFYSGLSLCYVAKTLERFFLWGQLFSVLLVERFIGLFWFSLTGSYLDVTEQVQSKKLSHLWRCRLEKVRNIFWSKIKLLHYAYVSISHVQSCKVTSSASVDVMECSFNDGLHGCWGDGCRTWTKG